MTDVLEIQAAILPKLRAQLRSIAHMAGASRPVPMVSHAAPKMPDKLPDPALTSASSAQAPVRTAKATPRTAAEATPPTAAAQTQPPEQPGVARLRRADARKKGRVDTPVPADARGRRPTYPEFTTAMRPISPHDPSSKLSARSTREVPISPQPTAANDSAFHTQPRVATFARPVTGANAQDMALARAEEAPQGSIVGATALAEAQPHSPELTSEHPLRPRTRMDDWSPAPPLKELPDATSVHNEHYASLNGLIEQDELEELLGDVLKRAATETKETRRDRD